MGYLRRRINQLSAVGSILRRTAQACSPKGKDYGKIMMRVTRTVLSLGAAGLILWLVAGCDPRQNVRGNLPTQEQISQITPGVQQREDVRSILGAPSVISTFDENIWYYIGRRTTQYAFFQRNIVEQQVLIVRFGQDGAVSKLSRLDKSAAREVEIVERETPSAGRKLGLLEQLFGNIGRFADSGGGTRGSGGP